MESSEGSMTIDEINTAVEKLRTMVSWLDKEIYDYTTLIGFFSRIECYSGEVKDKLLQESGCKDLFTEG